jgi:hypothetical protein
MHHTGSQKELSVAVPEEQARVDQQEVPALEVQEAEEQDEELPECVDHEPIFFERDKPRSIPILLLYKAINYIYKLYVYCCVML